MLFRSLVRPAGDMLGLHSEFLPASKRYINDYVQYVKSDFLAGLGFGATQQLGETTGIYMGYSVDTGRNVYLQPSLASQGVKGTVTNALASAFVGSLGGGKSFCNNLLVYYAVLFKAVGKKIKNLMTPARYIVLGFLGVIAVGTILLVDRKSTRLNSSHAT